MVSIIVPVYNVEKYLPKCLDSILAQTFKDFELLLIDDGSPDTSGAICDDYAQRDPRIRVFHQENKGVSAARNVGLDHAKGEWIAFVDADDWMESHWLGSMVENMEGTDLVISGFHLNYKGQVHEHRLENKTFSPAEYSDACAHLMKIAHMGYLWSMLFSNIIIREKNLRLNERMCYQEDLDFILRYVLHTKSFRTIDACAYHYTLNRRSIYRHNIEGIKGLLLLIDQLLIGEGRLVHRSRYAVAACQTLARHCDKDSYAFCQQLLSDPSLTLTGGTAHSVRWVVKHLNYTLGKPLIKIIYLLGNTDAPSS